MGDAFRKQIVRHHQDYAETTPIGECQRISARISTYLGCLFADEQQLLPMIEAAGPVAIMEPSNDEIGDSGRERISHQQIVCLPIGFALPVAKDSVEETTRVDNLGSTELC